MFHKSYKSVLFIILFIKQWKDLFHDEWQNVFPSYWWTHVIYFPISLHLGRLRLFVNYTFSYKTHPKPLLCTVLFPRDQCTFQAFLWYRQATLSFSSGGQCFFFFKEYSSYKLETDLNFYRNQFYCRNMYSLTV